MVFGLICSRNFSTSVKMASTIKTVTIIGGGLMGSGIAQVKPFTKLHILVENGNFIVPPPPTVTNSGGHQFLNLNLLPAMHRQAPQAISTTSSKSPFPYLYIVIIIIAFFFVFHR